MTFLFLYFGAFSSLLQTQSNTCCQREQTWCFVQTGRKRTPLNQWGYWWQDHCKRRQHQATCRLDDVFVKWWKLEAAHSSRYCWVVMDPCCRTRRSVHPATSHPKPSVALHHNGHAGRCRYPSASLLACATCEVCVTPLWWENGSSGAKIDVMECVPHIVWIQTLVPVALKRSEWRVWAELNRFLQTWRTGNRSSLGVVARCVSPSYRLTDVPIAWYLHDPSPGNHTLRNTKDICHMDLRASFLQHPNTTRQLFTQPMASLTLLYHCYM
jgi:hypothetical protein